MKQLYSLHITFLMEYACFYCMFLFLKKCGRPMCLVLFFFFSLLLKIWKAQQDLDNPSLFTFNATGWCLIASVLFALCRPACTRWYEFRYSPSLLPTTCALWQQNYIVLLLVNLPSLCLSTRSPRIRNTSFLFFCTELLLAAGLPHRNALANNETGVLTEGWKTAHLWRC